MAATYPADDPLLSGPFEPLREELDCLDLYVEGELPPDLAGTLYRIGPNPQFPPIPPYNPLQGNGMVHAFAIERGRVAYRNRWVRTRQWVLERAAGRALFATADRRGHDPSVAGIASEGAANTHIVTHAGRLLALEEGHAPIEMDAGSLDTLGPYDFGGRLPGNMTSHPKTDPESGELVFFANFPDRTFDGGLLLYTADAAGERVAARRLAGPYPALVHDFAITRAHVVFVVCPLTLSLERIRAGRPPIAWEPDRGAWVGVVSRAEAAAEPRWLPAPACMAWHTLNAYDDGGRIRLDLCQQAAPAFPTPDGVFAEPHRLRQRLERWTIDPDAGEPVTVRTLSDTVCEYPRIDERFTGLPYRYGFLAAEGGPGADDLSHRAIARYDHATGEMALWRAPPGHAVSEPVFVPRRGSDAEGDGYLLLTVFDAAADRSHLVVLDAQRLEAGPLARAHLAHRVPAGFHGSFAPRA